MKRSQFWIAGGVVFLAVAFVGWKSSRAPKVEVITAELENITLTLAASGVLESKVKTTLSSQLNGALVREVRVDIGSRVKAGDILVVLEAAEFKAQIQVSDALIKQSDSQLALQDVISGTAVKSLSIAKEELASVIELKSASAIAKANTDIAIAKVKQARNKLKIVQNGSRPEQIRVYKAIMKRAVAQWELYRRDAERSDILYQEGEISQKNNEVVKAAKDSSLQDVEAAREQILLASKPRVEDVFAAELEVAEAQTALVGANATLTFANKALGSRLVVRKQLIKADGDLKVANSTKIVNQATRLNGIAQRQSALASMSKTVIRAPIDGRVAQRLVERGQTLSAGNPIIVLHGETNLRVKLNIEEARIALVKLGAKAIVGFDAFPKLQLPAVVSEIGSSADFQLGTIEVRLNLSEIDSRLKPQLTADANIIIADYFQKIIIPQSALIYSGDNTSVYIVNKKIVKVKMVTWVKGNAGNIIIKTGLEVGDLVLINPRESKPGSKVEASISKSTGVD